MKDSVHLDAADLFREHGEFVERMLSRYGVPPADLADLVQEVFLIVHKKGGFEPRQAKATTWLAAIAGHVALRHRRAKARGHKRETLDPVVIDRAEAGKPSPRESAQAREELKRVRRALRRLPGTKRAVFVMFELEGRSCNEIAATLRIPVGTVYSRLHAARAEFAQSYGSSATDIPLALSDSISYLSIGIPGPRS
jgi:RNA polymerase sigma-70 factor (ECF subfamily)